MMAHEWQMILCGIIELIVSGIIWVLIAHYVCNWWIDR